MTHRQNMTLLPGDQGLSMCFKYSDCSDWCYVGCLGCMEMFAHMHVHACASAKSALVSLLLSRTISLGCHSAFTTALGM